jgi:hypothetical protein
MDQQEFYKKWAPLPDIPDEMWMAAIHNDSEGFRIILECTDPTRPQLRIRFEKLYGYRNFNESYRLKTWTEFRGERPSSLFIVENSKLVRWFHQETTNLHANDRVVHYAIHTGDDCIDILASVQPTVEWL